MALRPVARSQNRSLADNARALALNMGVSDASVASFATKYHYKFWRPETAIHAGDTDPNKKTIGDPVFEPYIPAPCFPGYPSNHGSLSNAAREVLESLYGPDGHDITFTTAAAPGVTPLLCGSGVEFDWAECACGGSSGVYGACVSLLLLGRLQISPHAWHRQ